MPDVLIYGDSLREPALRHEVPIGIGAPFLYVESGGERLVVTTALELPRVRELPDLTVEAIDRRELSTLFESGFRGPDAFEEDRG